MTAKEYLKQAERIELRIQIKKQRLQGYKDLATKVNTLISDMPSGTRDVHSKEKLMVQIVDLEQEIEAELQQLIDVKREINNTLSQIPNDDYRLLLELRYICNERWERIARQLHYSKRSVYRHHGRALMELEKILSA